MVFLPGIFFIVKQTAEFPVDNFTAFKIKMLNWANQFSIFCLLDNHRYGFEKPSFECLFGIGSKRNVTAAAGNAFETLKQFSNANECWLFGHFGYDLKNETEQLKSENFDGIGFPDLHFFEPEIVLQLTVDKLIIHADGDVQKIYSDINSCPAHIIEKETEAIEIKSRIDKQQYTGTVEKLRTHILRGDCYEINFCQEFFSENAVIDPLSFYSKLSSLSPNPFSALYKLNEKYCICASPERYIKKSGSKIISQPIKGTSKRDISDARNDNASRQHLLQSEKEKSENTMVVDLVRNDLSRVCMKGTVKVKELFGIYSFPQVHQMISTIEGEVEDTIHWTDIIKATFPMGSMTGAPKKRVMELIEKYEQTKRGLFSGAIGYVMPSGDFDFNVIIRSILYNAEASYISYQAGSAITFNSEPEEEYRECLVKVSAIKNILKHR